MQKIKILAVGSLKEKYLTEAVSEYTKRLKRFCKFEIVETQEKRTISDEAQDIAKHIEGILVVFAIKGVTISSEKFAGIMQEYKDSGNNITFVIGSSHGLSQEIKDKANLLISLSRMTFPHQLARVICCEQIYRAFMINAGAKYHK